MSYEPNKHLADALGGLFIAKAILKDYATVVAKIEGIEPKEVEERIIVEANKLIDEFKENTKDSIGG